VTASRAPRRTAETGAPTPARTLTLPVPPSANTYWRHVGSRVLLSAGARQYRVAVASVCIQAGVRPIAGPVALTLRWYRARRAGDLDNRVKQLLDSLRGYGFADDSQIEEIHAYRDDTEPESARVVVTLSPATPGAAPTEDR
jgi:crossover junction endodeoxyribonuclease RusA